MKGENIERTEPMFLFSLVLAHPKLKHKIMKHFVTNLNSVDNLY